MAGEGRTVRDSGDLSVTNFADEDNVGIMSQERAESCREGGPTSSFTCT